MTTLPLDVIDHLAGIASGSRLDSERAARPQARTHAQKSFEALFEPAEPGAFAVLERHLIAAFVVGLHQDPATAEFYARRVAAIADDKKLPEVIAAEINRGLAQGPYGNFPQGPLTAEDLPGLLYRVSAASRNHLDARLAAALEHAHMLIFHPRDAGPDAVQSLLDAGWNTNAVVTLSQLVSFLSFQIRLITGLRALAA